MRQDVGLGGTWDRTAIGHDGLFINLRWDGMHDETQDSMFACIRTWNRTRHGTREHVGLDGKELVNRWDRM